MIEKFQWSGGCYYTWLSLRRPGFKPCFFLFLLNRFEESYTLFPSIFWPFFGLKRSSKHCLPISIKFHKIKSKPSLDCNLRLNLFLFIKYLILLLISLKDHGSIRYLSKNKRSRFTSIISWSKKKFQNLKFCWQVCFMLV